MAQRVLIAVLLIWLAAAVAVGASGALARVPPPMVAFGLTIVLLLALRFSRAARTAAVSLGPAPLVAFHLVRVAAGAYFLILYGRGVLPDAFAIPAGWGDIAVGLGAAVVLAGSLPPRTRGRRIGLLVWNIVGLIDILGVLANGLRLFAANQALGQAFTTLPLALLPTFVVPIVIVSHVLLFAWTRPPRRTG